MATDSYRHTATLVDDKTLIELEATHILAGDDPDKLRLLTAVRTENPDRARELVLTQIRLRIERLDYTLKSIAAERKRWLERAQRLMGED